jgi:NAD(P)-dependent dehydrogenase (short-subunit alcohol dehydrogenase family)
VSRVVVVTGATRGIGREVARRLAARGDRVVLGARRAADGRAVADSLVATGPAVDPRQLDVADPASVARFARGVGQDYPAVDVLVNNAAVNYDTGRRASSADLQDVRRTLETNLFGAWAVTLALLPLLRASEAPRVVNVSSEGGSLTGMGGGTPAYSVSKAALNALTRMLAAELADDGILVNSVCPAGSRRTWAAREGVRWAPGRRASFGRWTCRCRVGPVGSSGTAGLCRGDEGSRTGRSRSGVTVTKRARSKARIV